MGWNDWRCRDEGTVCEACGTRDRHDVAAIHEEREPSNTNDRMGRKKMRRRKRRKEKSQGVATRGEAFSIVWGTGNERGKKTRAGARMQADRILERAFTMSGGSGPETLQGGEGRFLQSCAWQHRPGGGPALVREEGLWGFVASCGLGAPLAAVLAEKPLRGPCRFRGGTPAAVLSRHGTH